MSEMILYRTEDGRGEIQLRLEGNTVWLTQLEIAELFDTTKQKVSLHIQNVLKEKELRENSVVKESLTTAADGKNYLSAEEVDTLDRLVVIFLEQAELRVRGRKDLTLDYWRANVDRLLQFNERPVLNHAGRVSHEEMKAIAHERYETFDAGRRAAEALAADAEDIQALEQVEAQARKHKRP